MLGRSLGERAFGPGKKASAAFVGITAVGAAMANALVETTTGQSLMTGIHEHAPAFTEAVSNVLLPANYFEDSGANDLVDLAVGTAGSLLVATTFLRPGYGEDKRDELDIPLAYFAPWFEPKTAATQYNNSCGY